MTVITFCNRNAPDAADPDAVALLTHWHETAGGEGVAKLALAVSRGKLDIDVLRGTALDLGVLLLHRRLSPEIVAARTALPVPIVEAWARGLGAAP